MLEFARRLRCMSADLDWQEARYLSIGRRRYERIPASVGQFEVNYDGGTKMPSTVSARWHLIFVRPQYGKLLYINLLTFKSF